MHTKTGMYSKGRRIFRKPTQTQEDCFYLVCILKNKGFTQNKYNLLKNVYAY